MAGTGGGSGLLPGRRLKVYASASASSVSCIISHVPTQSSKCAVATALSSPSHNEGGNGLLTFFLRCLFASGWKKEANRDGVVKEVS